MDAVSYTYLRQNMKDVFDRVSDSHETVIVTRKNGDNMVILSQEDFDAIQETMYLLQFPANVGRLQRSLENSLNGNVQPHIIDDNLL